MELQIATVLHLLLTAAASQQVERTQITPHTQRAMCDDLCQVVSIDQQLRMMAFK